MRKIIITTRKDNTNYFEVSYLLWLTPPAARQAFYTQATKTSSAPNIIPAELTAIQTGSVLEQGGIASFPSGTTNGVVAADIITKFNTAQTALNNISDYAYYGSSWDGTTWTLLGN